VTNLVVVHLSLSEPMRSQIKRKMYATLDRGFSVYLLRDLFQERGPLPYVSHPNLMDIPSFIDLNSFEHIPYENGKYIGKGHNYAPQFLALKKSLVENKVSEVDIVGSSRGVCVQEVFDLVTGNLRFDTKSRFEAYRCAAKYLGFSDRVHFIEVYSRKLSAKILEDLCT